MAKIINIPEHMIKYISKQREFLGGLQIIFKFPNGYGASVIHHNYSYDLELAVLDSTGHITYDTPITDDVLGYLDDASLEQALIDVMSLEADNNG